MSECSETIIALFIGVTLGNIMWMTLGDRVWEWRENRKASKRFDERKERMAKELAERRKKYEGHNNSRNAE
jgi:membrane protein DedA with SNARE-associated domain